MRATRRLWQAIVWLTWRTTWPPMRMLPMSCALLQHRMISRPWWYRSWHPNCRRQSLCGQGRHSGKRKGRSRPWLFPTFLLRHRRRCGTMPQVQSRRLPQVELLTPPQRKPFLPTKCGFCGTSRPLRPVPALDAKSTDSRDPCLLVEMRRQAFSVCLRLRCLSQLWRPSRQLPSPLPIRPVPWFPSRNTPSRMSCRRPDHKQKRCCPSRMLGKTLPKPRANPPVPRRWNRRPLRHKCP